MADYDLIIKDELIFDGQIFWDPYCSLSGWQGVTLRRHRQL